MTTRTRRRAAATAAPVVLLALVGLAPAAGAAGVPATERLTTQVVPNLSAAHRVGDVDPATQMTVDLLLSASGTYMGYTASQLETHLYTPGDPRFHQFLTPDQYAAAFGAPSYAAASAASFGTSHGLSLVQVDARRDVVELSGTAAQVEATFGTRLGTYTTANRTFFANDTAPLVPSGIGVFGVAGLDDATRFTTASAGVTPSQSLCVQYCTGTTTPQDMWKAYDQPTGDPLNPGTTDFGQGQQLAVIGEGETATVISDLQAFEAHFGLPAVPVTVDYVNGPNANYKDTSGDVEWDIDMQSSVGMAPDASKMTLYFGSALDDVSLVNAVDAWVNQADGALQANMSIDGCEGVAPNSPALPNGLPYSTANPFSEDLTFQRGFDAALQEAVDTGRTLFNSSGDVGSGCPYLPADTNGAAVQPGVPGYPTSSPHVVSVGGTVLYGTPGTTKNPNDSTDTPITGRGLEYAWNFSGGGFSQAYPEPSYQAASGLVGPTTPCLTNPATGNTYVQDGQASPTACRAVPDIAAQSGDIATNGYAIYSAGAASQGGGTSLASPLSMGMWARIQAADTKDKVNGAYVGNGFANYAFYKMASAGGAYDTNGDFFDVGGTTKSVPNSNGLFVSGPGYDEVTGLGVMDVNKLLADIDGGTVPTSTAVPPAATAATGSGTGTGTGTSPAAAPATVAACYPLFTDPAGDDNFAPPGAPSNQGQNPQLDIVQGDLHGVVLDPTTHKPSATGSPYLEATLTLKNLSANPPTVGGAPAVGVTANQYYLLWTVGATTYFASAQVDPTLSATGTPSVTYGSGKLTKTGSTTTYSTTKGSGAFGDFNPGPNGTIDIYVPDTAANVGATADGQKLMSPYGQTSVQIGSSATGGLLSQTDSASPQFDYTLGELCGVNGKPGSNADPALGAYGSGPGAPLPEAPWLAAVPAAGAYAAYRVLRRRRRRLAA